MDLPVQHLSKWDVIWCESTYWLVCQQAATVPPPSLNCFLLTNLIWT